MDQEPYCIKKKIKFNNIDVHPMKKALVVNYETEAIVVGENEQVVISDKRDCQKLIIFKGLSQDTDCALLAEDVINKCQLIHRSKLLDVEHLISYLKNRKDLNVNGIDMNSSSESVSSSDGSTSSGEKATLLKLESYVELLYEDMFEKIKGSSLILEIARDSVNLDELSKNGSVLNALARVLREDWKKSLDLTMNIVHVFLCFSMYTNFHGIIAQYKIGSLCMEIIQQELKRYYETKNEVNQYTEQQSKAGSTNIIQSRLPLPRSLKSAVVDSKSKAGSAVHRISSGIPIKGRSSLSAAGSSDTKRNGIKENGSENNGGATGLPGPKLLAATETDVYGQKRRHLEKIMKKQSIVLQYCFHLLMNISENEKIEDKIRKRNIVELIVLSLDTDSVSLLIVLSTYLKKLSVYRENKDEMYSLGIAEKLFRLLTFRDVKLETLVLQLFYNLSFDTRIREQYIKLNLVAELIRFSEKHHHVMELIERYILGISYHLTITDDGKLSLAPCAHYFFNRMIADGGARHDSNSMLLISICLNLALNSRCAEQMVNSGDQNEGIKIVIKSALENNDVLFMKIIRNISFHASTKAVLNEYAAPILQAVLECDKEDFVLECVGVLGNLSLVGVDFYQLLQKNSNVIAFVKKRLGSPASTADDMTLELLVLLGTMTYDENCAEYFHDKNISQLLIDLLKIKQEDDEIVLQIIYVFYQFLQHPFTRDDLIKDTDAPAYFIDLMHDNNPAIRKLCRMCLETIKEFDESWTDKIKTGNFQWHNADWLQMIQNQILDKSPYCSYDMNDEFQFNLLQNSALLNCDSRLSLNADSSSSILHSADSSRCISRYDSGTEDVDSEMEQRKKIPEQVDPLKDALKNLIITNDIDLVDGY